MILDSGKRRQFYDADGNPLGVRDIAEDKGRCDLLPLGVVAELLCDVILGHIAEFMHSGDTGCIADAIKHFWNVRYESPEECILEVSMHYKEGCKKYGERNWEKGIPCHCYVDSGVRHYLKWLRGDEDERHDRGFVWNMLGLLWTLRHKPELNDLPCKEGDI